MIATLIAIVVTASALWVYWDATSHNIGRVKSRKGLFNMSAESWALATFFLWVIAFPAYLIKRGSLREDAEYNPVHARHPRAWLTGLAVLGAAMVWNAYSSQPGAQLPGCASMETKGLVKDLLTRNFRQSGAGEPTIHINAVRTTDSGYGLYRCKAFVDIKLPGGRVISGRSLRYTSTLSDQGRHLVEIQQQR